MTDLGFPVFDADNHYYEAEDAFTRHIDPKLRKRAMQWAEIGGRKRLLVGGRVNRFIPNPTFDPIAKPGCLDEYFRGRNPKGADMRALFGDLEPIRAEYRNRDARLALMDEQNMQACFMFPTLGVGMEESLKQDPVAVMAAFRAFNRWVDDDWGLNYQNRIFAAPYFTLASVDWAVEELEWALDRDVRVICLRSAPVSLPTGNRSLGDRIYDPFWSRVNEAGVTVAFHSGDAGYQRYAADWGETDEMEAFRHAPLKMCLSASPVRDTMAALVCHGVFSRHPNLRVASIESGSDWVGGLIKSLQKAHGQMPQAFAEDPVESFCDHVWVAPFYEDNLTRLRDAIGAEHILMGSDYPHAEGLANPTSFVDDLDGFSPDEIRLVMRNNALALSQRRPAAAA